MGLIQTGQNTATAAGPPLTLTVTLGSATTAGNSLVVLVANCGVTLNPSSVTGITLGGSAGNFTQVQAFGTTVDACSGAVWTDLQCAAGQTSVVISTTGGTGAQSMLATVYEWNGLVSATALDKQAQSLNSSAAWTSTATATTTQNSEVWFGSAFGLAASAVTITGPSSPWTNSTQQSTTLGTNFVSFLTGYQERSATGAATYAGSTSPSSEWVASVNALKLFTVRQASVMSPDISSRAAWCRSYNW